MGGVKNTLHFITIPFQYFYICAGMGNLTMRHISYNSLSHAYIFLNHAIKIRWILMPYDNIRIYGEICTSCFVLTVTKQRKYTL